MAGLMTPLDVVNAGLQGVEWGQQNAEVEREKKRRDLYDEAGKVASKHIDGVRAQHILNGGDPAKFSPSSADVLKAADEYGKHLAKAGDWQGFLKNDTAVAPMRLRAIGDAVRAYQLDKDPAKLAEAVFTIGGQEIKGIESLPGGAPADRGSPAAAIPAAPAPSLQQGLAQMDAANTNPLGAVQPPAQPGLAGIVQPATPGDGRLGAPSGAPKLRVTFADGRAQMLDPATLEQDVMQSLQDPLQTMQELTKLRFATMTQRIKTEGQKEVEREKGGQARKTEAVRGENARGLAAANNTAAQQRTDTTAAATRYSADRRGDSADYRTDNPPPRGGSGAGGGVSQANRDWQQATRDADLARKAMDAEIKRARERVNDNLKNMKMTDAQRLAAIEGDASVKTARSRFEEADRKRAALAKAVAKEGGGGLSDAAPAAAPAAPEPGNRPPLDSFYKP